MKITSDKCQLCISGNKFEQFWSQEVMIEYRGEVKQLNC